MEIRDFVQAVLGALVLKPDEVLLASALYNSTIFSKAVSGYQLGDPVISALSIAHVFLLILGLGLLMGIGPTSSAAISFFVVLGVAGGLFAIEPFLNAFPQALTAAEGAGATLASLVVQPYVSDLYVIAPVLVFAAGIWRWNHTLKSRRAKSVNATQASLRQHCTYCGARIEPMASKCKACGKSVSTKAEIFCTECGKVIPRDAAYCGFCGGDVLRGAGARCHTCGKEVAASSRYCIHCGARLRAGAAGGAGYAEA